MNSRDRILAAARAIFERDGLDGLSIRIVAREAGMSPMGLYRHFPNKDAIVDALMLDGFVAWEGIVRAIEEPDPLAWLRRVLDAFLEFAVADPNRFNAAFLLRASGARKYPDDFAAGRSPVVSLMTARIDEAKAAHQLADAPSTQIALTLSALAQGLVSMERAGRFGSEEQFRTIYATTIGACLQRYGDAGPSPARSQKGRA